MELELPWLLAPNLPSNKQVNLTCSSITLGHKMSLPGGGYIWPMGNLTQRSDQMSTWPAVVSHLVTRCSYLAGGYIWPKGNLTEVVTHLATRFHCCGCIWPQINLTNVVTHLATRYLCLGKGQVDILLKRQSANQPARYLQLASQSAMWKHVNLSDFRLVRYLVAGGLGAQPHWAPAQCPSTLTGSSWGSDLPNQGQASDTNELCSPLYTFGITFRNYWQFCIYMT